MRSADGLLTKDFYVASYLPRHTRLRADAGLHLGVPQPDCAHPAGGDVRPRRATHLGSVLDDHLRAAGAGRPEAELRYRAVCGAIINGIIGTLLAWVLVRYTFPGRKVIDAMIDLPFALPTAVAGIALTALYAPTGWSGSSLTDLGFKIAYTPLGITLALTFVTLPFVVRTVQPVLADIPPEVEEAAACLGAKPLQVFRHISVPALLPAWLTGFALAFARGVGEYGSVIFIAGNMPMKTEILPLLIMVKLDQYDYTGATAIGVVMLVVSFVLLLLINLLQRLHRTP